MTENQQPQFAFGKKLGINESLYHDLDNIQRGISLLMQCMKETNALHNVHCEFFRLDFRPPSFDEDLIGEFPIGSLVLDMKWGSKKELEEKNNLG